VEVATDKVNTEIPSPYEGRLIKISVAEGTTIPVGVELAVIELAGADVGTQVSAAAPEAPTPVAAPSAPTPRPRLSPVVRRLAEEHGIDPTQIQGTGENGRVTREDVLAYLAERQTAPAPAPTSSPPPAAPSPAQAPPPPLGEREELVRLTAMRRSIAEHMTRSVLTSPHAWTLQEIDVSELVRYRESEKEAFRQRHGIPLSYLPFVVQVLCDALHEFPFLNSSWTDDGIVLKRYINLGIAVALPDGLIVPVVRDADQLGFTDLARAIQDVVDRARDRRLRPEDVQGGTFTLNNTGAIGSIASQPIINQPQAAILTTESILRRPVVIGEGIAIRHMMNVCLSFDHRIIDGLTAGRFLAFIKERLESWTPSSIRL
jgi:2-oxoisovalerate dehydrogenase E2 component (dihydrolipoyl transacylase)